ncbi:MAG: hemolysin III family protein [Spirochaetia bacterium]|jgi:hemolysin III|nr:hemolysin III family protein [Spirochaetia bacterium]
MEKNRQSWLEKHITLPVLVHPEAEGENFVTHAIGIALSIFATIYLLVNFSNVETTTLKVGLLVYCFSMILLYTASALYHKLPVSDAKRFCRILDHSNIYFLIAGTYTAVLLSIGNPMMVKLTLFVWFIALAGVAFTLIFWGRLKPLHVVLYLTMGWIIVFFWNDIVPNLKPGLFRYILAGGITYTIGVIFYAFKKIPHGHAIWHLFVLAGSILFYVGFAIYCF